jgi:hypothetical protein
MSLFPDEDVLTKEIETWRGFIDKLPSDEDKAILTKLLNECYKYSLAVHVGCLPNISHQPRIILACSLRSQ